jgi:hypothetical protein
LVGEWDLDYVWVRIDSWFCGAPCKRLEEAIACRTFVPVDSIVLALIHNISFAAHGYTIDPLHASC